MANQAQTNEYFNLHLSGIGYLSRVRWVSNNSRSGGRRSEPFLSCAINALRGSSDDPQYTYLDLKVTGADAIEIVRNLEQATNEGLKVIVSFKAADLYIHQYDRRARDAKGNQTDTFERAALIKGRLILINTAKVDGKLVYRREAEEAEQAGGNDAGSTASQPDADLGETASGEAADSLQEDGAGGQDRHVVRENRYDRKGSRSARR